MADTQDADAKRIERLIASNEVMANAINRLVQVLERKERKASSRSPRVRQPVKAPSGSISAEEAAAAKAGARAALARLGIKG